MKPATGLKESTWRQAAVVSCLAAMGVFAQADDWTRFRGPNGSATTSAISLPSKWSAEAVQWKIDLKGDGDSAPAIMGNRLFITVGQEKGKKRQVVCLDAISGQESWRKSFDFQSHKIHAKNSFATSSPTTDGDRVYVTFADEANLKAFCLDLNGNLIWTRDLGPFASQHGSGASPIIYRDLLIVPNEQDAKSSIVGLDKATGKTVWSLPRRSKWTSYATPFVLDSPRGDQMIILSTAGLSSLDPRTGKLIWNCDVYTRRTVSSPFVANGLVIGTSGERGKGDLTVAVKPDGTGEVAGSHVVWKKTKTIPYCPTPLAVGDSIYSVTDNGIFACFDAKTGGERWTHRVSEAFSSSPILSGDRFFFVSEDGVVYVLAADPTKYRELGRNPVEDNFLSTPAVAANSLYLRGGKYLWRLADGKAAGR